MVNGEWKLSSPVSVRLFEGSALINEVTIHYLPFTIHSHA